MFRNPHILSMSISSLEVKYYLGIIVTVASCLCMIYILVHIQRQYNTIQQYEIEELDIGSDTILELEHEIPIKKQRKEEDEEEKKDENDGDNLKEKGLDSNNVNSQKTTTTKTSVSSTSLSSYVNVTIENDDYDDIEKTNNNGLNIVQDKRNKSNERHDNYYRKLLPSQWIIIMIQVFILTLFNYLLLVYSNGWLSFIGMAVVYSMTLRHVILDEIIRYQRLDRFCLLITLCFSIATGLTCIVYTNLAIHNGYGTEYLYQGPARIIGYDTSTYNNDLATSTNNNQTIRSNLKVAWGGTWGCPNMPEQFCTADVNGILCDTTVTTNNNNNNDIQSSQTTNNNNNNSNNNNYYYTFDDDLIEQEEINEIVYNGEEEDVDDYVEVLYKDKNEEVDVESKYDANGHEVDAIDVIMTNTTGNGTTEAIEIKHDESNANDQINITYGTSSTSYNTTDIGNRGEDTNSTTTNGGNRQRYYIRLLTSTVHNTTNNNTKIQQQVSEQVQNISNTNTKNVKDFEDEVYNEALDVVNEDINDDMYVTEEMNEMSIEELQNENEILMNENNELQQENEQLQIDINQQINEDQSIIEQEDIMIDNKENQILNNIGKNGITNNNNHDQSLYNYQFDDDMYEDDYWNTYNSQQTSLWGEYSCQDLFNQQQYMDLTNPYDPTIPPPGYINTNNNTSNNQKKDDTNNWPTIQIYGNCLSCTAYIIDYYSTEHYHTIQLYSKQMTGYCFTTIICFIFTIFFYIRYQIYGENEYNNTSFYYNNTYAKNTDKRKDLLSSTHGSSNNSISSMNNNRNNSQYR